MLFVRRHLLDPLIGQWLCSGNNNHTFEIMTQTKPVRRVTVKACSPHLNKIPQLTPQTDLIPKLKSSMRVLTKLSSFLIPLFSRPFFHFKNPRYLQTHKHFLPHMAGHALSWLASPHLNVMCLFSWTSSWEDDPEGGKQGTEKTDSCTVYRSQTTSFCDANPKPFIRNTMMICFNHNIPDAMVLFAGWPSFKATHQVWLLPGEGFWD